MTLANAPSDAAVFDAWPSVPIDRDNIEHYRGLLTGRLLINRCADCGYWVYPHRPLCPQCLSWALAPTEVSGAGHVHMFTLIHQERDPGSTLDRPLITAAIELAEQPGLRYLAPVVHCEVEEVRPDMPVRLVWIRRGEYPAPAFEPERG